MDRRDFIKSVAVAAGAEMVISGVRDRRVMAQQAPFNLVTSVSEKRHVSDIRNHLINTGVDPADVIKKYYPSATTPYSTLYQNQRTGEHIVRFGMNPMCKSDNSQIVQGWDTGTGKFTGRNNTFDIEVLNSGHIAIDFPGFTSELHWNPQLFVGGIEVLPTAGPYNLGYDPLDANLIETDIVLAWDYGDVCKRCIRIVHGSMTEFWQFIKNPGFEVRIKHNSNVPEQMILGRVTDFSVINTEHRCMVENGDEEVLPVSFLNAMQYPISVFTVTEFGTTWSGQYTYTATNDTWASIIGQASANQGVFHATQSVIEWGRMQSYTSQPGGGADWVSCGRGGLNFDISAIGAANVVSAGTLQTYGANLKDDQAPWAPAIHIVSNSFADPETNDQAYFSDWGSTSYVSVAWATIDLDGPMTDWALDATGVAYLESVKTAWALMGCRLDADIDANPPAWAANKRVTYKIRSNNDGTAAKRPDLDITFAPSGPNAVVGGVDGTKVVVGGIDATKIQSIGGAQ